MKKNHVILLLFLFLLVPYFTKNSFATKKPKVTVIVFSKEYHRIKEKVDSLDSIIQNESIKIKNIIKGIEIKTIALNKK